jgi:thiol-disulfide isomerase/thioredoxin
MLRSVFTSACFILALWLPAMANAWPSLAGGGPWFNSKPLTNEALAGKVVLVDFWTYSCINCLRTLPYLNAWYDKYHSHGLVIVGVHTPEFPFEKLPANVQPAIRRYGIHYPVVLDNAYAIWNAFQNQYWPAHYLVDAKGKVRYHHFGEGGYREEEDHIRELLAEAGKSNLPSGYVTPVGKGAEAADSGQARSPETYVGYGRMAGCVNVIAYDVAQDYVLPASLSDGDWGFVGHWKVVAEYAQTQAPKAAIAYNFLGRDLHLVMGSADGKPVRFRVLLDGKPPGADHGADVDARGYGEVSGKRLYQLIRQQHGSQRRQFEIRFLGTNVRVFAFTFG